MDPKTLPNLDPKLKEVYERVMGSSAPQASPAPQPSFPPPTQTPPPAPVAPPQPTVAPQTPPPPVPPSPTPTLPNNNNQPHATQVFNPHFSGANKTKVEIPKVEMQSAVPTPSTTTPSTAPVQTAQVKGKFKIGVPVIALAGVVFLILYAFFWASIFKIRLPF